MNHRTTEFSKDSKYQPNTERLVLDVRENPVKLNKQLIYTDISTNIIVPVSKKAIQIIDKVRKNPKKYAKNEGVAGKKITDKAIQIRGEWIKFDEIQLYGEVNRDKVPTGFEVYAKPKLKKTAEDPQYGQGQAPMRTEIWYYHYRFNCYYGISIAGLQSAIAMWRTVHQMINLPKNAILFTKTQRVYAETERKRGERD